MTWAKFFWLLIIIYMIVFIWAMICLFTPDPKAIVNPIIYTRPPEAVILAMKRMGTSVDENYNSNHFMMTPDGRLYVDTGDGKGWQRLRY